MPQINATSGTPIPRFANEILASLLTQAEAKFGKGVRNEANSIRQVLELYGVLGFSELEQDFLDWIAQVDPRSATGEALTALLWPLFEPLPAKVATGIVNVNYSQIPTSPTPLFNVADLEFIDGVGARYALSAEVDPPAKLFDSNETGTASETIGSTNARISQAFPLTSDEYVQLLRVEVSAIVTGTPIATIRIETDDGTGKPSGTLADPSLELIGMALAAGSNDVIIASGANLDSAAAYHVVIIVTGGTVTFDGGAGGTANSVYTYTGGSWIPSTLVENLKLEVLEGGAYPVSSTQVGPEFNIEALAIAAVSPANPTASALFATIADTFTNLEAFTGGRDAEAADSMRTRARLAKAARDTGSVNGIAKFLVDFTDGVDSADVVENVTMEWVVADTVLDNGGLTGSDSSLLDATPYDRLAQKFVVAEDASVAAIAIDWATMAALDFDIRIETDNAGDPSGTLVSTRTEKTGITPAGTGREVYSFVFPEGDFLPAGTYHAVLIHNSGSGSIEGAVGTPADYAKRYNAGWTNDTPDNYAIEVFGGIPPKSIRAYVDGGNPDDIALALSIKAGGIKTDGPKVGFARDARGVLVPYNYFEAVLVPVVIRIDLDVTAAFTGDESTIKDLLIEHIGGVDTEGEANVGLGISVDLIYEKAQAAGIHGDVRTTGVNDFSGGIFYIARKSDVATPGLLTGSNTINLGATRGERFIVEDPDDIQVTLTVV